MMNRLYWKVKVVILMVSQNGQVNAICAFDVQKFGTVNAFDFEN